MYLSRIVLLADKIPVFKCECVLKCIYSITSPSKSYYSWITPKESVVKHRTFSSIILWSFHLKRWLTACISLYPDLKLKNPCGVCKGRWESKPNLGNRNVFARWLIYQSRNQSNLKLLLLISAPQPLFLRVSWKSTLSSVKKNKKWLVASTC